MNKLYEKINNILKQINAVIGDNPSLKNAIVELINNSEEIVAARKGQSSLAERLNILDSNLTESNIDKNTLIPLINNLNDEINDIKKNNNIILVQDENKRMGLKLDNVIGKYEKLTTLEPNTKKVVYCNNSTDTIKSYVKTYGEFIADFNDKPTQTKNIELSDTNVEKSNAYEINNGKLRNKKFYSDIDCSSAYITNNNQKECELPGVFYATISKTANNNILNLFNGNGFINDKAYLILNVNFNNIFITKIKVNTSYGNNEGYLKLNIICNNGKIISTSPNTQNNIEIDVNDYITKIEFEWNLTKVVNTIGFTINSVKFETEKYLTSTEPIIIKNIETINNCKLVVDDNKNNNIKYALQVNDNIYCPVPLSVQLDKRNSYYTDGVPCTTAICCGKNYYKPSKYKFETKLSKNVSIANSNISFGTNKLLGIKTFENSIMLNNIICIIKLKIKETEKYIPLTSLGDSEVTIDDKIVKISLTMSDSNTLQIFINEDSNVSIDELSVISFAPYKTDETETSKSSYKNNINDYFIQSINKKIINIVSNYNVTKNNGNIVEPSTYNSLCNINYALISANEPIEHNIDESLVDEIRYFKHTTLYSNVALPALLTISSNAVDDTVKVIKNSIVSYKADSENYIKNIRNEVITKFFKGKYSLLTKIIPSIAQGTPKFLLSNDGNTFLYFNKEKLKWEHSDIGMTVNELSQLNDSIYDSLFTNNEVIYIKAILNPNDIVDNYSLTFNDITIPEISLNNVKDYGMTSDILQSINFNTVEFNNTKINLIAYPTNLNEYKKAQINQIRLSSNSPEYADKWIPIEYTDVREYKTDNNSILYVNKSIEQRIVKTVISSSNNSVVIDTNKQNYVQKMEQITSENKNVTELVAQIKENIDNIIKTLTGSSDRENNFLLNNYKEYDSGIIENNNSFIIPNVSNIVSTQIWSEINDNLKYIYNINAVTQSASDYETKNVNIKDNGAELQTKADANDAYRLMNIPVTGENTATRLETEPAIVTAINRANNVNLNLSIFRNTDDEWIGGDYNAMQAIRYNLTPLLSYGALLFDFKKETFINSFNAVLGFFSIDFVWGLHGSYNESQIVEFYGSHDNLSYEYITKFEGATMAWREYAGWYPKTTEITINKKFRYIKLVAKSKNATDSVYIDRLNVNIYKNNYVSNKEAYLYNKNPIDISGWKEINDVTCEVLSNEPLCSIKYMVSPNKHLWYSTLDNTTTKYDTINYDYGMNLTDLKVFLKNNFDIFTDGKLYVAVILYTSQTKESPLFKKLSLSYITSNAKTQYVTLDPHDIEVAYSPEEKQITIHNISGGQKKFKVLVS